MANALVLGVREPRVYALASGLLAAGHRATVALSREVALRKVLPGIVDLLVVDSPLGPGDERAAFAAISRAVPTLPTLLPRSLEPPPAAGPAPSRLARRTRLPLNEPLLRAIAYLFGLAEGRRHAFAADLEIPGGPGATPASWRGLATDVRDGKILVEFLRRADRGRGDVPADATAGRARLRMPGGGTLTIEGRLAGIRPWEGAPPAAILAFDGSRAAISDGWDLIASSAAAGSAG
ncbi:MAG: hypothetical protein L0216_09820 [Planctomycetales bacterium]|nr:hypothetical protein [Planctomycetales bacterium]